MKKFLALFCSLVLIFSLIAGCSSKTEEGTAQENNNQTTQATQENKQQEPAKTEEKPKWQTENITLTYASWENAEVEAKMLQAFMEKYPNITVEKDASINWPWTDALTTAASAGNLPDVFFVEQVPIGIQNDWLLDITSLWDNDPDTQAVYPNIAATGVYGGKRFVAPTSQNPMGVFVNKTLFEKFNVEIPPYNWTFDQMVELAKKLSDPKEHYYGIGGPWGDLRFEEWLPMANDTSVGYNTFDGEKFHFTNQDWINGWALKAELRNLKIEEHMTGEEKKQVFGDEGAWPALQGRTAIFIDGMWNVGWLPAEMEKNGTGELDFYPYPGGKAGQRMPVLLDYIGISSTTEHPEAAYELMKFMSFGKDGWLKRLEIQKELNLNLERLPAADYPEVWAAIDSQIKVNGVREIIKLLPQAVPDFGKTLPGLADFNKWAWDDNKIWEKIYNGEITPADAAKQLEEKANEFVSKASSELLK